MGRSAYDNSEAAKRLMDDFAARDGGPDRLIERLKSWRIETPSWGYADAGTRFGTWLQPSAARTIQDKLSDAGQVHKYTGISPTVAVHVSWDFPDGFDEKVIDDARAAGVQIGAINPNLFQEQCYKLGSLANPDQAIRGRAVQHCLDSIDIGRQVGSKVLSLWLADGTNYPGQDDIVARKQRLAESLRRIHEAMPDAMELLIEYKPFEPAFYHTDIADWGMACILAKQAGQRSKVLVDLGHHYQGQNVEQIVAWLIDEQMLGGFHLNDRRYADDDLTIGSIDPYQMFRIFDQIVSAEQQREGDLPIAYMIDQAHCIKNKVEAMIQTVSLAHELWAKALLVDRARLRDAQFKRDAIGAEEALRGAFFIDTRALIGQVRQQMGLEPDALAAFRASGYDNEMVRQRGSRREQPGAAGLGSGG
jgi:L-rhamnose isomerase/sugar isomerase